MKRIYIAAFFLTAFFLSGCNNDIPIAEFPTFLNETDKMLFEQAFSDNWSEIGLRSDYVSTVQPKTITAIDENGKEVQFKRNDNVGFRSWDKEGDYFVYKFVFGNTEYTHKSNHPFALFYGVKTNQIENWRNLWGRNSKDEKSNFIEIYNSIANNLLKNIQNEDIQFSWLRNLEKNYRIHINKSLITPSKWAKYGLTSKQYFKYKYELAYQDITPVMIQTFQELGYNSLIYVHRTKGVRLYDENFEPFKKQLIEPYFNEQSDANDTPFRFRGYTYKNNQRYIVASFMGQEIVNIKVSFFDDLLPVKPSKINYQSIVSDMIGDALINCDEIALSFVYLDRQLHYNLIHNPNSPERFKFLIAKISSKSNNCKVGIIGPKNKIKIPRTSNNEYVVSRLKPSNHKSNKIKIRPDPIVRAYYNNLDFLIPAWCDFNSKGERQRRTGIKPTSNLAKFPGGYLTLRGKYTVEVPNLGDLLSSVDLSSILTGYGIEKIVFNTERHIPANPDHNYRKDLKEKIKTEENAAIFYTKSSYKHIAKNAYSHEDFTSGEFDIIAKGLREFNNLLRDENDLEWVGGSKLQINEPSGTPQNVVVPVEIEQLGLERRPIKAKFKYRLKM